MNLDNAYVLDTASGTFFQATYAVIIDGDKLSEHERELLQEGSDSVRRAIGRERGDSLPEFAENYRGQKLVFSLSYRQVSTAYDAVVRDNSYSTDDRHRDIITNLRSQMLAHNHCWHPSDYCENYLIFDRHMITIIGILYDVSTMSDNPEAKFVACELEDLVVNHPDN